MRVVKRNGWPAILAALLVIVPSFLTAQTTLPLNESERSDDQPIVTHHQITLDGKVLKYTARAGYLSLRDEYGKTHARIFYMSYTLDPDSEKTPRPLTFAWNGGPGSASSLLHLGALGPLRAKDPDEYSSPPPPYELVENKSTWLDFTDLVFVDPVGTGYSYATDPQYAKEFYSPQGDIDSIAEFIRLYLAHYSISQAPLFVVGESYGTFRAAGMAEALAKKRIHLNGVILLSSILNFQLADPASGNDLPYVLLLPSYTAAAFVHKKLPADLQSDFAATLRKAETWAENQYSVALLKGDRLTNQERDETAHALARFTGLDTAFIEKHDLRIGMGQFTLELLRDQQEMVGHYDTRMTAKVTGPVGEYDPTTDPSLSVHGISELIVPYLRKELGFTSDSVYAGPFGGRWPPPTSPRGDWMSVRWNWGTGSAKDTDQSASLARAMRKNHALRVFAGSGYYDLSTPYFETAYIFDHMGLDPQVRSHVELACYPSGHMIYLSAQARRQLKQDIASFYKKTLSEATMAASPH